MTTVTTLRRAVAGLSPRRRRWKALLRSCDLDPALLTPGQLAPLPPQHFLICGVPRSGTSLLTAQLFQPPKVVTVMEPWDGMRLAPAELLPSLEREIRSGTLRRGRLDIAALTRRGTVRWVRDGEQTTKLSVEPGFRLGVKWPAFWRYLGLLGDTKFLVCLRDPADAVRSFENTGGRLASGLDYDVAFNREMNAHLLSVTDDPAVRRVELYDYVAERLLPHLDRPNVMAVRFERWFTDKDGLLTELEHFLGVDGLSPGPAAISSPPHPVDAGSRALVRARSRTAAALGYDVDRPPG